MTTIAIDSRGEFIAADGQVTCSGAVVTTTLRKILVETENGNPRIYAMAGTTCMFEALVKWHKDGHKPSELPPASDGKWTLLVIDRKGARSYGHEAPYAELVPYPYALGTGNEYALGALKAGASAEEAVRIACEIDIHSGGEIQVVNIKEALGMAPRLVASAPTSKSDYPV